jgi:hypothetical protein
VEWRVGSLPFVECDTALMKQVFQNLLSNALKFTRPDLKRQVCHSRAQHKSLTNTRRSLFRALMAFPTHSQRLTPEMKWDFQSAFPMLKIVAFLVTCAIARDFFS